MHVVSRPRTAASVAIRRSMSSRHDRDNRSQSRFVGALCVGSMSSASRTRSSGIPAAFAAWISATRRKVAGR
jgi:hypothetical protein